MSSLVNWVKFHMIVIVYCADTNNAYIYNTGDGRVNGGIVEIYSGSSQIINVITHGHRIGCPPEKESNVCAV
jgi:hypothetical protein